MHGWADLQDAIITSCDTYFYQLGLKLGLEELTRLRRAWKFDQKTGIDLPNEAESMFPSSVEWYDEQYGAGHWGSGVVLNLAIGQGRDRADAAQARAVRFRGCEWRTSAATATSPDRHAARAGSRVAAVERSVPDPAHFDQRRGERLARNRLHARALPAAAVYHRGKSGTTEHNAGKPHGWFVAIGPMEDPQIVVAIVVEEGERVGTEPDCDRPRPDVPRRPQRHFPQPVSSAASHRAERVRAIDGLKSI